MSPDSKYFINFGMLVPTGQPIIQVGETQSRHRCDSYIANSNVNPLFTSILLLFLTKGSSSII